MQTDVVIVGKGIAGLCLAWLLQQQEIDYLLLGRSNPVKPLALAETLPPSALVMLERLGFRALFERSALKKTLGYHSLWKTAVVTDTNFFFQRPFQYGLKLDKQKLLYELEAQLTQPTIVIDKGFNFHPAHQELRFHLGYPKTHNVQQTQKVDATPHPCHSEQSEESLSPHAISTLHSEETSHSQEQPSGLNDNIKTITGNIFVDATGRSRALLKTMNIPVRETDHQLAFSCHLPRVRHPQIKHDVFTELFNGGWGIVSGLDEKTNVMTLFTDKGTLLAKQMRDYKNWGAVLAETHILKEFLVADVNTKVSGANANSACAEQIAGPNWLAIGDAAIAFDPLSSHGITNAVYCAWQASLAIAATLKANSGTPLLDYANTLSKIFESYLASQQQLKHTTVKS